MTAYQEFTTEEIMEIYKGLERLLNSDDYSDIDKNDPCLTATQKIGKILDLDTIDNESRLIAEYN